MAEEVYDYWYGVRRVSGAEFYEWVAFRYDKYIDGWNAVAYASEHWPGLGLSYYGDGAWGGWILCRQYHGGPLYGIGRGHFDGLPKSKGDALNGLLDPFAGDPRIDDIDKSKIPENADKYIDQGYIDGLEPDPGPSGTTHLMMDGAGHLVCMSGYLILGPCAVKQTS